MRLAGSEIKNLVDAVEMARSDMGRGFFWYYLRPDGIFVEDHGLTDTGYANLAVHVRRHVDPKRWAVTPGADGLRIEDRALIKAETIGNISKMRNSNGQI